MDNSNIGELMYTVYPRTILRNVPNIGFIMKPGSFKLTKEAVLVCLKGATVYRKFSADHAEKVTILNLDRLHNETFITEEEWKSNVSNITMGEELINNSSDDPMPDCETLVSEVSDDTTDTTDITIEDEVINDTVEDNNAVVEEVNSEEVTNEQNLDDSSRIEGEEVTSDNDDLGDIISEEADTTIVDTELVVVDSVDQVEEESKEEVTEEEEVVVVDNNITNTNNSTKININYNGKKKHK